MLSILSWNLMKKVCSPNQLVYISHLFMLNFLPWLCVLRYNRAWAWGTWGWGRCSTTRYMCENIWVSCSTTESINENCYSAHILTPLSSCSVSSFILSMEPECPSTAAGCTVTRVQSITGPQRQIRQPTIHTYIGHIGVLMLNPNVFSRHKKEKLASDVQYSYEEV